MISISSNTIVRDGMPFIGKVLMQVAPFMEQMIITISEKSTDSTLTEIKKIQELYPDKIVLNTENVSNPGELTNVRNEQVKRTKSDWILFLDDDDYWLQDQLELCLTELDKDPNILAYSVNPYQLIDFENHDISWRNRYFSKFLRREGLQYVRSWPKDMPADKNGKWLYHKTNSQVKNLPYKFYHLSYLKDKSFRTDKWAGQFKFQIGRPAKLSSSIEI